MNNIPTRKERLYKIFENLVKLPRCHNSLEAYKQLTELINTGEDLLFGFEMWNPPRTFLDSNRTERLYTIYPESFHEVKDYLGVTILIAKKELIFISRYGAIEVQEKIKGDEFGNKVHFSKRKNIIVSKKDAYNDNVWHIKNII